ncbi:MAG: hypothetical protein WAM28_03725 [Chlamydiales bacterium]
MMAIALLSSFSHPYFTEKQQANMSACSLRLQEWIQARLISSRYQDDVDSGKLILSILPYCSLIEERRKEEFFQTLLQQANESLSPHLKRLYAICQRGGARPFFSCITTRNQDAYPLSTLLEIINDFHQIILATDQSLEQLSTFPCYDEEGKECLIRLREQPGLLQDENFFLRETVPSGEASSLNPPRALRIHQLLAQMTSFSTMKSEAIRYLSALSAKQRSSMRFYSKVFNKLQKDKLEEKEKVALIKLIVLLTTRTDDSLPPTYSQADISKMLEEAYKTNDAWGIEVLLALPHSVDFNNSSLDTVTHCLYLLNALAENPQANEYLMNFLEKKVTFSQLLNRLENIYPEKFADVMNLKEDIPLLIERFAGKDVNVLFPLSQGHLDKITKQYEIIQYWCHQWQHHNLDQLTDIACTIRTKADPLQEEEILQLVVICRLAMRIKLNRYLYPAQVLAILGQLGYEKGAFAQIKTGEGKSLITAALAFILAMQNKRVHIISSSQNLAVRDRDKTSGFFEAFGINTSHICSDQPESDRFQANVLYGTASDFEFAVMREMLYCRALFPEKAQAIPQEPRFDCLIIDELDNLTVDTAASSARLGYPAQVSYEWVYTPILQFVKEHISEEQQDLLPSAQLLGNLKEFLSNLSGRSIAQISDKQLQQWIQSAYVALFLRKEKHHYVIVDQKNQDGQIQKAIVIIDAENTGRLMHGCRWSNGVHEFVELKHGIAPKAESLLPISLSHSLFYPMHRFCYGFSGTLGLKDDREAIQAVYGNETFDVPTHRPSQRKDAPVLIFASNEEYVLKIIKTVKDCRDQGRPILVLCETIQDSEEIAAQLIKEGIPLELINEIQDKPEEDILEQAGYPGSVTVATNTAGRGTDIILKENSNDNGGLHVLLTFYPESHRVEEQARGRAGRQGQRGSSEIFVSAEKLQLDASITNDQMAIIEEHLSLQRETQARILKQYHRQRAELERNWFSHVRSFFESFQEFNRMIKNETVLGRYTHALSDRKLLRAILVNEDVLSPRETNLSLQVFELLTSQELEPTMWKALLKQVAEQLSKKVIIAWSVRVYQEVERLLNDSTIHARILQQEQLRSALQSSRAIEGHEDHPATELFRQIEENLAHAQREEFLELKKNIENLYHQESVELEKYLDPSGKGIIRYLEEITQVDFTSILRI